jgi:hypothetical protein
MLARNPAYHRHTPAILQRLVESSSPGDERSRLSHGSRRSRGSDASRPSQKETRVRRAQLTEAIEERLKRGQDEGDVSASSDIRALARYVAAVLRGMAVESASGATGEELHRVGDVEMSAWPD